MNTRPKVVFRVSCLTVAGLLSVTFWGQSLGELARQQRAQRASQPKATRVYTNDNLPHEARISTIGPEAAAEAKAAQKANGKSRAELEKDYRAKAAKLREALAAEEKKWKDLQRQSNLGRRQEVEKQKAALAAAQKALEDLEEELRRKGLPPGWAR